MHLVLIKNHNVHVCCTSMISNKFGLNLETVFSYILVISFLNPNSKLPIFKIAVIHLKLTDGEDGGRIDVVLHERVQGQGQGSTAGLQQGLVSRD